MPDSIRTFWKGHLRLALLNIEIRLVSAEKSEANLNFHQVDRKTRQRIKYTKTVPGKGEVKKDDIVMGASWGRHGGMTVFLGLLLGRLAAWNNIFGIGRNHPHPRPLVF